MSCSANRLTKINRPDRPEPRAVKVQVACQYPDGFYKIIKSKEECDAKQVLVLKEGEIEKVFENWADLNEYANQLEELGAFKLQVKPVPLFSQYPGWENIKTKPKYTAMILDTPEWGSLLSLHKAIQNWNTALGYEDFITFWTPDQGQPDLIFTNLSMQPLGEVSFDTAFNSTCTINIDYGSTQNAHVIMHEIGHCVGLAHDTRDTSLLMYPMYDPLLSTGTVDEGAKLYMRQEVAKLRKPMCDVEWLKVWQCSPTS